MTMSRALVFAVVVLAMSPAAAKGKGAAMSLDFKKAALSDVLRLISDVGRANIVILDGADTPIDITAKDTPWDDVLADVIAKANLAVVREGSLYIVGPQAVIDERKKLKKRTYAGPTMDIELVGVDAPAAAALVAMASAKPFVLEGGRPSTLRLRRAPTALVQEMLMLQTGATPPAPPPPPADGTTRHPLREPKPAKNAKAPCAAARLPIADIELVGVAKVGIQGWGMFGTKTSAETFIVAKSGCLGIEALKVKYIGFDVLEAADGPTWNHPTP
jgi:hypothetical protein